MNIDCTNRLVIHVNIPNFQSQIIAWKNIAAVLTEFDIGNRRDDFREEWSIRWILRFLKYYLYYQFTMFQDVPYSLFPLPLAFWSHNADSLISANLIVPLLLLYMNKLHWWGWNSAAVITSVNSSILAGLMSTMSISSQDVVVKYIHYTHHTKYTH